MTASVDGAAAIRASLDRGLEDLERRLSTAVRADVDRMPERESMASTTTSPANAVAAPKQRKLATDNATTDMGGSQLQTAVDRGDYESQASAVGAQKEETRRKPEADSGPLGNQTGSINFDYDDKRYTLARREMVALRTIAHIPSDVVERAAKLIREAEGLGSPLGGEGAPSMGGGVGGTPIGSGDAGGGASAPGAAVEVPNAPLPQTSQGPSSIETNLQEVIRQKAEDVRQKELALASSKEVLEQLQSAVQEATIGPEVKAAGRKMAGDMDTPQTVPGGGRMTPDRFSWEERRYQEPNFGGAKSADDALAREAREANDKASEKEGHNADPAQNTLRDGGDYPLSRSASKGAQWDLYDRAAGKTAAATARPGQEGKGNAMAQQGKTAAADELAPQDPTGMGGTYESSLTGNRSGDEIDKGTTPTLVSDETESVANDANRELAQRSRETMRGSVTGAVDPKAVAQATTAAVQPDPIFQPQLLEQLKVECKRIDDARDALVARVEAVAKDLARGAEVRQAIEPRVATLKGCGDVIEKAINADGGDRKAIRQRVAQVLKLAQREIAAAQRDLVLVEAAAVEAKRVRDREERIGPAIALAVHQVKAGMLGADELPAKIGEYMKMDRKTFSTVARTIEEVGARALRATTGSARSKTASRLPVLRESASSVTVPRDELDGMFNT